MIRLNTTTRSLRAFLAGAITTSQLPITVGYSDGTTANYSGAAQLTLTNSATPVTICAAPAASTIRDIDYIAVSNTDTVAATVTIQVNDNGTFYEQVKATLQPGRQLVYTHAQGWNVGPTDATPLPASPTASVGLVAVNGVASTYMRSDAAPALSQSISPTWSGNHTFSNPITGSVTGSSGSTTGNAATATALQTARAINGVSFNGTADITVTAAADTLTGGAVTAAHGGTGQAGGYAVGDLLYASAAAAMSKLPAVAAGNALISGGVTTAPSWGKIGLTTHVSGVLPIANGGNGTATPTANPSASVGLAAVNGAATTYMRSDAAPALSQAIVPTWTGQHIWNFNATAPIAAKSTSAIQIAGANSTNALVDLNAIGAESGVYASRANNTAASPTALTADQNIYAVRTFGYGTTGYSAASRGTYAIRAAETWSDTAQGTYHTWVATPSGGTSAMIVMNLRGSGQLEIANKLYLGSDAGATQTACGLYANTGAPNNANGANGDIYFRADGGALTTIYQKRAGAWVGII